MCRNCGCDSSSEPKSAQGGHQAHAPSVARKVAVEKAVLSKNGELAARNRQEFEARGLRVINILSSPGSGKTELLRRTLTDLRGRLHAGVIVGDLATDNDARRIRESGAPAVQITTGTVCHLDAAMIAHALESLDLDQLELLFIENVGNLVCPAAYDLGEAERVVLLSVTEGEDKPVKYPGAFSSASVVLLSKIDIADAVGFDRELALENIRRIAPAARVLPVSARTGQGLEAWYTLLEDRVPNVLRR